MRTLEAKAFIALAVLLLSCQCLASTTAPAVASGPVCGGTITANTTLSGSLGPCRGAGLNIVGNGVTLDCQGHEIIGVSGDTQAGVDVSGVTEAQVKDCKIEGFRFGVQLVDSTQASLTADTATGSTLCGFCLYSSPHDVMVTDAATGKGLYGFYIYASSHDTLTSDSANKVGQDGFYLEYSNHDSLSGDTAEHDGQDGFLLLDSSVNSLSGDVTSSDSLGFLLTFHSDSNSIVGSNATKDYAGFELGDWFAAGQTVSSYDTSENNLTHDLASGNTIGFELFIASNNTLASDVASTDFVGYYVAGYDAGSFGWVAAQNNTLVGNTAHGNYFEGFELLSHATLNNLTRDSSVANDGYGYLDSTSGHGTLGTANTYASDACHGDYDGGSSPAGLCAPQG